MSKDILNSKEVIEGLQARDDEAYKKLLDYGWPTLRPHYRKLCVQHMAEDLFSATVGKLWINKCAGYNPAKSSFTTWLITVGRRDALNEKRREEYNRKISERMLEQISSNDNEEREEKGGKSQLGLLARRAYESLATEDQIVLYWRLIEGLPFDLIAENLGIKEQAARMRVTRARARLIDAIERLADFEIPRRINRSKRRHFGGTISPPHKHQKEISSV